MKKPINKRASFEMIRYANCWEDADLLISAAEPLQGKTCLSIASSGDNALAMLAMDPALLVAVDLSPAQIACVELRTLAFGHLAYEEMLWFLGFSVPGKADSRLKTYQGLRSELSQESRGFWDSHLDCVRSGIIYAGKFERYFKLFRTWVLPLIHSNKSIDQLLSEKDLQARYKFYDERWNNRRWQLLFKLFFSRFVMGRAGRDPEFFKYVTGSVAEKILKRTHHALTELKTHTNPYLRFILKGDFGNILPYYVRPAHFQKIKENLDRLKLVKGPVESALTTFDQGFDRFNLSDIFEYMDEQAFEILSDKLIASAKNRARFIYWNMLVPRRISESRKEKVLYLRNLSQSLALQDKAFFYQSFYVDEICL